MKIVFLDEYSMSTCDLSALRALGQYVAYDVTSPDQTVERCRGAEVVVTNKVVMDEAVISQLPSLKLICVAATGMNNVDLDAAQSHGVEVRNAVGYSTHSVAEATLASALGLLRQLSYYDRYVKSSEYSRSPRLFIFDRPMYQLHAKNWGVIGLGNIGREVARLASSFGCKVAYASTSGVERDEPYEQMTMEELLGWADVISIHSPLNESTRGLIGAAEFAQMKSSAIVINVARGGIIVEDDLAAALDNETIAGAATDVYVNEPIEPTSKLLTLKDPDRLLASTHNAWAAEESIELLVASIVQNIRDVMM
ncbi:MAG: NAD(P)-dependent oxidoreductase [Rikenellaceae bacterium]